MLENLYTCLRVAPPMAGRRQGGTFKRFATQFSSITQRPSQVASHVPHKI
jgi:hypothetical protein